MNGKVTQISQIFKDVPISRYQRTSRYQYDAAGNLIQKLDAKKQKTEYDYDDADRLNEIRYYAATDHTTPAKTVTFTYDNAGNLKTYDDGLTYGQYIYDNLHRKITEINDYGTIQFTKEENGVRSLNLTIYRFVAGFDEIVYSIFDLILVQFSDALGSG